MVLDRTLDIFDGANDRMAVLKNTNDRNVFVRNAIKGLRKEVARASSAPEAGMTPAKACGGGCAFAFDFADKPGAVRPTNLLPRLHAKGGIMRNNDAPPMVMAAKPCKMVRPVAMRQPPPQLTPREAHTDDKKSQCLKKIEAMQADREERRRRAAAAKAQREDDVHAAEKAGMRIEAVDFLRLLAAYRSEHGIGEPIPWVACNGTDVWAAAHGSAAASRIRVCVRKRPMLTSERRNRDFDVVDVTGGGASLMVHEPKTRVDLAKALESQAFDFDGCFGERDGNDTIYRAAVRPLVQHVLQRGGVSTVFAFGQTGSGKTCTMAGHGRADAGDGNADGLYKLAARELMGEASARGLAVRVRFVEIYRGQALDLLGGRARLEINEGRRGEVHLVGVTEVPVESADDLLALVKRAEELRAVGATSANETSSRSHAILQVLVGSSGKLILVDLAGSERASDANSRDAKTKAEGAEINKSLLALKECFRGLDSSDQHVPFRGSKLTHVLREAFVNDARTCMIANVAPGALAVEHTLNTLRYAQRVQSFSAKRGGAAAPPPPPPGAKRQVRSPTAAMLDPPPLVRRMAWDEEDDETDAPAPLGATRAAF